MTIIIPAPRSPRMSPGYRNSAALLYEVPTTAPAAGKAIVERGNVKNIAEVYLNGTFQDTAWKKAI